MSKRYALYNQKANSEIDAAVTDAVAQVQTASLASQDQIEYAYLIVREKLDRMEESGTYDNLSVGVSDTEVCEAVMNELGKRLGIKTVSLLKDYPASLSELQSFGLHLAP